MALGCFWIHDFIFLNHLVHSRLEESQRRKLFRMEKSETAIWRFIQLLETSAGSPSVLVAHSFLVDLILSPCSLSLVTCGFLFVCVV